jgi:hypothetical protein
MWLDKMISPQGDPWLLRWDLGRTNFLDRDLPPAFLYYNPWPEERRITIETAAGKGRVYDLTRKQMLEPWEGKVELTLGAREARVIEMRE